MLIEKPDVSNSKVLGVLLLYTFHLKITRGLMQNQGKQFLLVILKVPRVISSMIHAEDISSLQKEIFMTLKVLKIRVQTLTSSILISSLIKEELIMIIFKR